MGVECCGAERDSRHCPECGELLVEQGPLDSLLEYLVAQAQQRRHEEKSRKEHADWLKEEGDGKGAEYSSKRSRWAATHAGRWEFWAEHLRKAIAQLRKS